MYLLRIEYNLAKTRIAWSTKCKFYQHNRERPSPKWVHCPQRYTSPSFSSLKLQFLYFHSRNNSKNRTKSRIFCSFLVLVDTVMRVPTRRALVLIHSMGAQELWRMRIFHKMGVHTSMKTRLLLMTHLMGSIYCGWPCTSLVMPWAFSTAAPMEP